MHDVFREAEKQGRLVFKASLSRLPESEAFAHPIVQISL